MSQPWKVIISSEYEDNLNFDKFNQIILIVPFYVISTGAVDLYLQIPGWMQSNGNWESSLREIITADSYVVKSVTIQHPIDYFNPCKFI